jgi:Ca2+-binding EF-hand superfamily protein
VSRYRFLPALVPLLLFPWPGGASDASPGAPPEALPEEVQDAVFLGPDRPVRLRLRLRVQGEPFRAVWDRFLAELFAQLDRDGDGVLSKAEAGRAPKAEYLRQILQGELVNRAGGGTVWVKDFAAGSGPVTFAAFKAYYQAAGCGPLQLSRGKSPAASGLLTDRLFHLLDRDRDGKLSSSELADIYPALAALDADEDERVSAHELVPYVFGAPLVARVNLPETVSNSAGFPVLLLNSETPMRKSVDRLLRHYDRNGDGRLSRAEIGLPRSAFDALDDDGDGFLDRDSVARWLKLPPRRELLVRLTNKDLDPETFRSVGTPEAFAPVGPCGLTLSLDDAEVHFRTQTTSRTNFDAVRKNYLQRFKLADLNSDGALDEKELQQPVFQFLKYLAGAGDRDGDGRLTLKEFEKLLDVLGRGAAASVRMEIGEGGRGLFELLDADGDGNLDVLEMRPSWTRLRRWDRNGDGLLAREELPLQFHVQFSRGFAALPLRLLADDPSATLPGARPQGAPPSAPLWFRKMDRNRDGFVSRREFLGSDEQFRRLDQNGDGLISVGEALQAMKIP